MKLFLKIYLIILVFSIGSCAKNSASVSVKNQNEELYNAIWNRENFPLPGSLTDYEIDYALRNSLHPRVTENNDTSSLDYFFLCGQFKKQFLNSSDEEIIKSITSLEMKWGRTECTYQILMSVEAYMKHVEKKSSYFQLSRIKEERIRRKDWNP